jgi:coenzyme F420 hydrogenase subunit beta
MKCARAVMDATGSQNGGVVTALLETAMEEGFIDCAIVMGGDKWAQKAQPVIAYYPEDLRRAAGSKYDSNAVLESMKGLIKDHSINNVAIVGTPCTIESLGLLRKSPNEYAQKLASKVRFSIGLFCFESFMDGMVADVTGRLNVPAWRIAKMNAGEGKMTVTLRDGAEKAIPLSSLVEHVKPGCRHCGDFTAKMSDISVGSVGSKPGTSSVVIRTVEGMGLYQIAKESGYIDEDGDVNVAAVEKVGKLKVKKNGF